MEDLLIKVTPYLDKFRFMLYWIAEKIAGAFTLEVENVFFFVILALSIWGGKKLFDMFYSNTEGRWGYWIVISAIIFFIIKYLGVN